MYFRFAYSGPYDAWLRGRIAKVTHQAAVRRRNHDVYDCLVMVALCNRADHIYFHPVSFFLSSFFISSPNLSGRRLDVYHTSTHGVALVRI